ncbi:MAG: glycosyltransferase [Acidimicrobiales bacterium]
MQEAANIGEVLRRLRATCPDTSVLVVDDGSPDGTADLAERIGAEIGSVEVMRRPRPNRVLGTPPTHVEFRHGLRTGST